MDEDIEELIHELDSETQIRILKGFLAKSKGHAAKQIQASHNVPTKTQILDQVEFFTAQGSSPPQSPLKKDIAQDSDLENNDSDGSGDEYIEPSFFKKYGAKRKDGPNRTHFNTLDKFKSQNAEVNWDATTSSCKTQGPHNIKVVNNENSEVDREASEGEVVEL